MDIVEGERSKYAELWSSVPDYRTYSPGKENVLRLMEELKPRPMSTLLDVGCGTGEAGLEFQRLGLDVRWLDITNAGLDKDIPRNRFIEVALWSAWPNIWKRSFDYGFCCDVMEHIPPEFSMLVIDRIVSTCRTTWFQIALVPDKFGAVIGQPLHLTVRPFTWWRDHIGQFGDVVDARDLCGQGLFVVEKS